MNSNASSKEEFCSLTVGSFKDFKDHFNDDQKKVWHDSCMKSDHPNVFICPNKGPFKYDKEKTNNPNYHFISSPKWRSKELR